MEFPQTFEKISAKNCHFREFSLMQDVKMLLKKLRREMSKHLYQV